MHNDVCLYQILFNLVFALFAGSGYSLGWGRVEVGSVGPLVGWLLAGGGSTATKRQ